MICSRGTADSLVGTHTWSKPQGDKQHENFRPRSQAKSKEFGKRLSPRHARSIPCQLFSHLSGRYNNGSIPAKSRTRRHIVHVLFLFPKLVGNDPAPDIPLRKVAPNSRAVTTNKDPQAWLLIDVRATGDQSARPSGGGQNSPVS